jgi:hypothetical protein
LLTVFSRRVEENPKTKGFAAVLTDSCVATTKSNEYSYLAPAEEDVLDSDEEDDSPETQAMDADVFGPTDHLPAVKSTSFLEAQQLAIDLQRQRQLEEDDAEMYDGETDEHFRYSRQDSVDSLNSSPAPKPNHRVNNGVAPKASVARVVDDFEEIDVRFSSFPAASSTTLTLSSFLTFTTVTKLVAPQRLDPVQGAVQRWRLEG